MEGGPATVLENGEKMELLCFCGSGRSQVRVRLFVDKRERGQCMGLRLPEEENRKSPHSFGCRGEEENLKGAGNRGSGPEKMEKKTPPMTSLGMRRNRGSPHEEGPPLSARNKEMSGGLSSRFSAEKEGSNGLGPGGAAGFG